PAPLLLPVHRTQCRDGPVVPREEGRTGLDRMGRLRHGQPERAARLRYRPRGVLRVRLRDGDRTHTDAPARDRGHARHHRRRYPLLAGRGALMPLVPLSWLREHVDVPAGTTVETLAADLVRVGLEEEEIHSAGVTGPLVVGRVLEVVPEPQKNGKTINWCQVDVGAEHGAEAGGPRGIVCGAD